MSFRHLLIVLFLASSNASAQHEYDSTVFSAENFAKLKKFEAFCATGPEAIQLVWYIDQEDFHLSDTEMLELCYHPMAQVRERRLGFVYYDHCKQHPDCLFDYLMRYIGDSTIVSTRDRCMVYDTDFASLCYDTFFSKLTREQQQIVYQKALLSDPTLRIQTELIEKLPENETSYPILEELVYKKHKIAALAPLLAIGNRKDIPAPLAFLATHRADAHWIMASYFDPSYELYIRSAVPEVLANNWRNDDYQSYFSLLEVCSPETRLDVYRELSDICGDKLYRHVNFLYWNKDSIPAGERDAFLLRIFPSIGKPDSLTATYLSQNYPEEFDHALEAHLLLEPYAYMDHSYGETDYALFLFSCYTNDLDPRKIAFCLQLIRSGRSPAIIGAVRALKETHRQEVIIALEDQHNRLVALQTEKRPGLSYEKEFGLDLDESNWMEAIQQSILEVNDSALTQRIATLTVGFLAELYSTLDDEFACAIISAANDPALYDSLMTRLETQNYQSCYSTIVRFLLRLEDPVYNERLKDRYSALQSTQEEAEIRYYRQLLEDYLVLPSDENE
jgi:hypothetical protein